MTVAVNLSPPPILQFLNNAGQPNAGGSILTQVGGVNYPTYQDSAGNTPLPNPIPLNSRGEISNSSGISTQLFLADGVTYTFTQFDSQGNQINQATFVTPSLSSSDLASPTGASHIGFTKPDSTVTTLDQLGGVNGASLVGYTSVDGSHTDLSKLATTAGAGMIGYSQGSTYATGTVGKELQKIGTVNLGALPAGTTVAVNPNKTFSGVSGGTTDFRGWVETVNATGTNAIAQVNVHNNQLELTTTGGVTSSFGTQSYIRAGLAGVGAINVTSMRVHDSHVANEGTGTINAATCYFADGVDLLDGTGPIQLMQGFYCGDQGHASRVTQKAVGFHAGNMTSGAPVTAAFYSEMQGGTGKWTFYSDSDAPNAFFGVTRIGDNTRPSDALEVKGFAKLSQDGTITATGSYHELVSTRADYIVHFRNTNASTPQGIRLRFTAAAPNNTTQEFIRCEDSVGTRMVTYSNGNLVNNNNSYGGISDERLKENVVSATSVLSNFRNRKFVHYNLINDPEKSVMRGVIAQSEQNISPELVTDCGDYLSYNYSGLAVESAQAVQELLSMVDDLSDRITALESKV